MGAVSDEALKQTPLHADHVKAQGRMVPFAGFELPVSYKGGLSAEHKLVRERAGLFDVSHMGELSLRGPGAADVVSRVITNQSDKLVDGQALYTCACNERGTILDDLIVYRRAANDWLVVCNASNREKMVAWFRDAASGKCDFADLSDETALIALQGPRAAAVLGRTGSPLAIDTLTSFHFRDTTIGGAACTASRTGYTGEDGFEIFCKNEDASRIWNALLEAGTADGVEPCGLGARDTLRLEARLSLYGNEIDETTNPLEAGLGWVTKLQKADFIGKDALVRAKEAGLTRKLVGFEVTGRGIARHGYPLVDDAGNAVGITTSGSPGPTVGKNIGLGYLPVALAAEGTTFKVDCRGKAIEAVVVKTPFYKRSSSLS